jgi:hypothetical protein
MSKFYQIKRVLELQPTVDTIYEVDADAQDYQTNRDVYLKPRMHETNQCVSKQTKCLNAIEHLDYTSNGSVFGLSPVQSKFPS